MRELATSYHGITWQRIDKQGLQWPVPTLDHPGTAFLHAGGHFARGRGLFQPADYRPPAELPDEAYPLLLTTGRRLWHYHTGTQTRRCATPTALQSEEWLELAPSDAARLGISDGDEVQVRSRRGVVRMRAWVTNRSPVGVVFSSFHFPQACINQLTHDAFDPETETAEYKACAVRIEPRRTNENRCEHRGTVAGIVDGPSPRRRRNESLAMDLRQRIEILRSEYPSPRTALLPSLRLLVERYGRIDEALVAQLAVIFGISVAEIISVATFYDRLTFDRSRRTPMVELLEICRVQEQP